MKPLLYIDAHGAQYWHKQGQTWQPCATIPSGPVWVLTNVAEERFAEVQVPRLYGRDRTDYLERELRARFGDTAYHRMLPPRRSGSFLDYLAPPHQCLFAVEAASRIDACLTDHAGAVVGVWATSLLLAQLWARHGLDTTTFVVLPQPQSVRILVLKDRQPLLTRLVPCADTPEDQLAEVVRTRRHLEHVQMLPRAASPHAVLLLAPASTSAQHAFRQQGFTLLTFPSRAAIQTGSGAQGISSFQAWLFDQTLGSPPGQLATRVRRRAYLSQRLGAVAYGASALCIAAALWALAYHWEAIASLQRVHEHTRAQVQRLRTQLTYDQGMAKRLGLGASQVRQAIDLEQREILAAPTAQEILEMVAAVLGSHQQLRMGRLSWRVMGHAEQACEKSGTNSAVRETSTDKADARLPRTELRFELRFVREPALADQALALKEVADRLAGLQGLTVFEDAALNLEREPLGNALPSPATPRTWCVQIERGITPAAVHTLDAAAS